MVAVHLGAAPVLVDIDARTLNIDPERIERAITPRTKAIVPVHIGGLACDMTAIEAIAKKHGLKIVEDAAHAFPTRQAGVMVGARPASDAAVFSFYANKTITTGEGGMIVTPHAEVAERCRVMRLHGIDRDALDRYRQLGASWYYEIVAPGYKYNLSDIAAAIGIAQLKKALAMHERRQAVAERYNAGLKGLPMVLPATAPAGDLHSWHLYIARLTIDSPIARDQLVTELGKKGIHCSVHYIPLHLHPYWRKTLQVSENEFPNATAAYRGAISLPLHARMTDDQVDYVIATVRQLLG
jgi:dTDP-4-amino-4,6-dideoxygalactose transaminase